MWTENWFPGQKGHQDTNWNFPFADGSFWNKPVEESAFRGSPFPWLTQGNEGHPVTVKTFSSVKLGLPLVPDSCSKSMYSRERDSKEHSWACGYAYDMASNRCF
jgi:hypothetical protein